MKAAAVRGSWLSSYIYIKYVFFSSIQSCLSKCLSFRSILYVLCMYEVISACSGCRRDVKENRDAEREIYSSMKWLAWLERKPVYLYSADLHLPLDLLAAAETLMAISLENSAMKMCCFEMKTATWPGKRKRRKRNKKPQKEMPFCLQRKSLSEIVPFVKAGAQRRTVAAWRRRLRYLEALELAAAERESMKSSIEEPLRRKSYS